LHALDRLIGRIIAIVAIVLTAIGLCTLVLDAFEIIFVIAPIAISPLLIRIADARWVVVLVLLRLQTNFLPPPFDYALKMVRGVLKAHVTYRPFLRAHSIFVGAAAFIAAGVVCSATPAYWRNRRRKQPRARQARVERIDRQDARANDHFCRHRPTRNDASLTLYLATSKPLTGNNILQMRGGS
jgi:hypothetical protein